MNCLDEMLSPEAWEEFFHIKTEKNSYTAEQTAKLRAFIDSKAYLPYVETMLEGKPLSPPKKKLLSKKGTSKKRVVYTYSYEENLVLKMLAWQLRKYDGLFSPNLYSFRCANTVRDALRVLSGACKNKRLFSFKTDISDYFNSIPVLRLLPMLYEKLQDESLCRFLEAHLSCPFVLYNGERIAEQKGVMAGTPISPFLANLYLTDLDELFQNDIYARYSDDILFFAETDEELLQKEQLLLAKLREKGLTVNEQKTVRTLPGEPWTFLGITYTAGETDISAITMKKTKDKLRRKARALVRWKRAKKATDEQATKAFIRSVNRKLFDNPKNTELTWCRWYFPLISTDESLKELDGYIQTCIRYVMFEHHGKKAYGLRYEQMKAMGYKSLVHAYYEK